MTALIPTRRPAAPAAAAETDAVPARRPVPAAAFVALVVVGAVLRAWNVGGHRLSLDETFTAMTARRSVGGLFSILRQLDSHPPLDYLLRMPFAGSGSDVLVRLPSVLFSIAALGLFAWWMRDRGRVGLIATALFAVSGFELLYGRQARMYALMELVGVATAVAADHWLRTRCLRTRATRRPEPATTAATAPSATGAVWLVAAATTVGVFTHTSALLLAAGVFWLPGFARDRAAWVWRAAVALPVVLWAALWGSTFLHQASGDPADWIPYTTLHRFAAAATQPLNFQSSLAWIDAALIAAGIVCVVRTDRRLTRVGAACFAAPVLVAGVLGIFSHFLLGRTLTFASWAPLVAVAFLVDALLRRWRLVGAVLAAALAVIVLSSTVQAMRNTPLSDIDALDARVVAVARPGDVVAARPVRLLRAFIDWNVGVQMPGSKAHVAIPIDDTVAYQLAGTPTGRVWLIESADAPRALDKLPSCAPTWQNAAARLRCVRVSG